MNAAPASGRTEDASDSGVATVWAAIAIAVLLVLMMFGVELGAAEGGRHRAEAAADLAALAAAGHALDGEVAACAHGARVAEGMFAHLIRCRLSGWEAFVEVEIPSALPLIPWGVAHGRARAGPVHG